MTAVADTQHQIGFDELWNFLQDPSTYIRTLQDVVNSLVYFPCKVAENMGNVIQQYNQVLCDMEPRQELRTVKLKAREIYFFLVEYIDLAEDLRSIADKEREQKIISEMEECKESYEKVFDFYSDKDRALFPRLGSFLAEAKLRVKKLRAECRNIMTLVGDLIKESSKACVKLEKGVKQFRSLKALTAVGTAVVGGIFVAGCAVLLEAGGPAVVGGAGAVGGVVSGALGYMHMSTFKDHEALLEKWKNEFDALHDTANGLAALTGNKSEAYIAPCQLYPSFVRPDTEPLPNLKYLPTLVRTLFFHVRSINLEKKKDDLMRLKTHLG